MTAATIGSDTLHPTALRCCCKPKPPRVQVQRCQTSMMMRLRVSTLPLLAFMAAACLRAATAAKLPSGCNNLLAVCNKPHACAIMRQQPPPVFDATFRTTAGTFTLRVVTAWAPPFARRFWRIATLRYMDAAHFYRVDWTDFAGSGRPPFMVQFGYSGSPEADLCWDAHMTSNETAPALASNTRGYASFSMNALPNKTAQTPFCAEGSAYCAIGFSTNIFINYGNNSREWEAWWLGEHLLGASEGGCPPGCGGRREVCCSPLYGSVRPDPHLPPCSEVYVQIMFASGSPFSSYLNCPVLNQC